MKEVRTRTAVIFIDEKEILHIVLVEGAHLDYEDAIDNALVVKNLTKNKAVLKLIDSRFDWTIDDKAQVFIRSNEIKEKTIARAVVKNSVLNSILLNFFNKLNRPNVPTKIFTDYNEAYNWLVGISGKGNR